MKTSITHENIVRRYTIRWRKYEKPSPGSKHWHQRAEILMIDKGACTVTVGKTAFCCRAGDVAVIQSGEIHAIANDAPCTIAICTFDPALLYHFLSEIRYPLPFISAERLEKAGIREEVASLFAEIYAESEGEKPLREMLIQSDVLRLYSLLVRHFERAVSPEKKDLSRFRYFQSALEFIAAHFTERITLRDVADRLHYNSAYVSTLFVTYTGMNFKTYLDTIRVDEAIRQIRNSDRTFSRIALECGFENIRTFNNTFKRVTGTTPGTIRSGNP